MVCNLDFGYRLPVSVCWGKSVNEEYLSHFLPCILLPLEAASNKLTSSSSFRSLPDWLVCGGLVMVAVALWPLSSASFVLGRTWTAEVLLLLRLILVFVCRRRLHCHLSAATIATVA